MAVQAASRIRSWGPNRGESVASVIVAVLTVPWSLAVLDHRLLGATLPGPGNFVKVLPYVMPVIVLAMAVWRSTPASRLEEIVTIWVILVLAAALLLPSLARGSLTPLAVPALAVTAPLVWRWPSFALFLVAVFSASFGSLQAFWHFPVEKAIALILAGLWVASLCSLVFGRSRPVRVSLGLWLLGAYLLITGVQVLTASDRVVAEYGAKDSAWFMLVVLLVAYAGWHRDVQERVAKGLLVVAVGAGAYALYRVIAGPAVKEYLLMAQTIYNFVNGKLKPGGSFGSAQNMGTWMAAVVPFCFASMLSFHGRWRLVALLGLALCTTAAIESQLRIALVGIVAGLLAIIVLQQYARGQPRSGRLGITVGALALGAILITVLISTNHTSGHSYRALLHPTSSASFKARQYKWTQALNDLQTHPFGYGVGTASYAGQTKGQLYFAAGDTNVDNGFLRIALEQGLVIMGLFALALVAIVLALMRGAVRERRRAQSGILLGAAGTLVSFLVVMLAEDATYDPRSLPTWLIVGLGMAIVISRSDTPGRAAGAPAPRATLPRP